MIVLSHFSVVDGINQSTVAVCALFQSVSTMDLLGLDAAALHLGSWGIHTPEAHSISVVM